MAGCLPAQRIAELLLLAVENGDVPYEGDLSEDKVDSALNELWELQRNGSLGPRRVAGMGSPVAIVASLP